MVQTEVEERYNQANENMVSDHGDTDCWDLVMYIGVDYLVTCPRDYHNDWLETLSAMVLNHSQSYSAFTICLPLNLKFLKLR